MPLPQSAVQSLAPALSVIAPGSAMPPKTWHAVLSRLESTSGAPRIAFFRQASEATEVGLREVWKDDAAVTAAKKLVTARLDVVVGPDGVLVVQTKRGGLAKPADITKALVALKKVFKGEPVNQGALELLAAAPVKAAGDRDDAATPAAAPSRPRSSTPPSKPTVVTDARAVLDAWKVLHRDAESILAASEAAVKDADAKALDKLSLWNGLADVKKRAGELRSRLHTLSAVLTDDHPETATWKPRLTEFAENIGETEAKAGKLADTLVPPPPTRPSAGPSKLTTNIPGVPAWFCDPVERKYVLEGHSEELAALAHLIGMQVGDDPKLKARYDSIRVEAASQVMGFAASIHESARQAESMKGKNPVQEMKDAYALFEKRLAAKNAFANEARPLWIHEQRDRLGKAKKKKGGLASRLAACMGEDRLLELSKMAEVMSNKSKIDPYKITDANRDRFVEPLDIAELAAIYGYTTADFTKINGLLRARARAAKSGVPLAAADDADLQAYIDACESGLAKIKPYKGETIRCERTLHASVVAELLASGTRTEAGFLSTGFKKVPGFGDIVTKVQDIKTGKDVTMFSLHTGEGEVLFPPGSVFRFVSYEVTGGVSIKDGDFAALKGVVDEDTKAGTFTFAQVS